MKIQPFTSILGNAKWVISLFLAVCCCLALLALLSTTLGRMPRLLLSQLEIVFVPLTLALLSPLQSLSRFLSLLRVVLHTRLSGAIELVKLENVYTLLRTKPYCIRKGNISMWRCNGNMECLCYCSVFRENNIKTKYKGIYVAIYINIEKERWNKRNIFCYKDKRTNWAYKGTRCWIEPNRTHWWVPSYVTCRYQFACRGYNGGVSDAKSLLLAV